MLLAPDRAIVRRICSTWPSLSFGATAAGPAGLVVVVDADPEEESATFVGDDGGGTTINLVWGPVVVVVSGTVVVDGTVDAGMVGGA